MKKETVTVQDREGNAVSGAEVYVRTGGGSLATVYSDNGVTPTTNPLTSDNDGDVEFYVADGTYTIQIYIDGVQQREVTGWQIYDDSDALLLSIKGLTFGADNFIYGTDTDTAAAGTITAAGRALVDDADAAAMRTTLELDGVAYSPDGAGRKLRRCKGVIRQSTPGGGWSFISDSGHSPLGFSPTITLSSGRIVLDYGFTGSKVIGGNVGVDEAYAAGGLVIGASIGTSSAIISLYAPFNMRISGTVAAWGSYLENGVDVTATFDVANGTLTVTHPGISHVDSNGGPTTFTRIGTVGNQDMALTSSSKTGFVANFVNPIYGRVNGAAITTVNVGSSAAWNGTDTLTITHASAGSSIADVSLTPEAATNIPICTGSTATTVTVQFRDYAGALVTGAASPGVFRFMRGGNAISTISGTSKFQIGRGLCQVRAEYVADSGGNIWVDFEIQEA